MANFNGLLLRTTATVVRMAAKAQEDSNHKVVGFPVPKGFGEMEKCFVPQGFEEQSSFHHDS